MNKRIITATAGILTLLFAAGFIYTAEHSETLFKSWNVKIEKSNDDTWRVRDINGNNKGTMKVNKKDKISWHAKGSDMVFIFSKDVGNFFEYDDEMFKDGRTQKIKRNKKLRMELKSSAPQDTLQYEVYVIDANTSVIGNSPPRIIIQ